MIKYVEIQAINQEKFEIKENERDNNTDQEISEYGIDQFDLKMETHFNRNRISVKEALTCKDEISLSDKRYYNLREKMRL